MGGAVDVPHHQAVASSPQHRARHVPALLLEVLARSQRMHVLHVPVVHPHVQHRLRRHLLPCISHRRQVAQVEPEAAGGEEGEGEVEGEGALPSHEELPRAAVRRVEHHQRRAHALEPTQLRTRLAEVRREPAGGEHLVEADLALQFPHGRCLLLAPAHTGQEALARPRSLLHPPEVHQHPAPHHLRLDVSLPRLQRSLAVPQRVLPLPKPRADDREVEEEACGCRASGTGGKGAEVQVLRLPQPSSLQLLVSFILQCLAPLLRALRELEHGLEADSSRARQLSLLLSCLPPPLLQR
eukprot:8337-Hanusia_phi.AAC.1